MISGVADNQRGFGAAVTSSLTHGSTSSSTTGGDHLPAVFDACAGGRSGWRRAVRGAGPGGGKPEAGSARGGGSGAATLVAAWCHGSTTSPCCASAALPTKSMATDVREIERSPTVTLSIAELLRAVQERQAAFGGRAAGETDTAGGSAHAILRERGATDLNLAPYRIQVAIAGSIFI
jgi:hypothetical protein